MPRLDSSADTAVLDRVHHKGSDDGQQKKKKRKAQKMIGLLERQGAVQAPARAAVGLYGIVGGLFSLNDIKGDIAMLACIHLRGLSKGKTRAPTKAHQKVCAKNHQPQHPGRLPLPAAHHM
ncbi:MAG: hypothetical protein VB087_05850 [Candidatus Limiplasma sp.]|nr:hypothetical protein [Candidatus Limiplasma sp.]MEA5146426.1 hypothetical protein [Candidatus Limiplasma sp.]